MSLETPRKDSIAESSTASASVASGGAEDGAVPSAKSSRSSHNKPHSDPAFLDALEDVHTRFILNLPDSELQSADRIFFQLEQAWWFYEDWICDPDPHCTLPRFPSFRPFAQQLFQYSPLLRHQNFATLWQQFTQYKRRISVYGCILLSRDCRRVVLCQVYNSKQTFTFPAGKINQAEDALHAAARETYEETGFDPLCLHGTTAQWQQQKDSERVTWKLPSADRDALVYEEPDGKRRTCYVCWGVPDDFDFAPVARKEVASVSWHDLDSLPNKTFAVIPFVGQLKRWIKRNHPLVYQQRYSKDKSSGGARHTSATKKRDKTPGTQPHHRTPTRGGRKNTSSRNSSRNNSRTKVRSEDDVLVESGLANVGDVSGWSEEDMFRVNEQLLGRKVEYDGNPHIFAEQGFAGQDPHAFRVVGGGFLNAEGGITSLAPAPDQSRLQPLFRSSSHDNEDESDDDLQPFFSEDGATPWGDIVAMDNKKQGSTAKSLSQSRGKSKADKSALKKVDASSAARVEDVTVKDSDTFDVLLTDAEITAKSQMQKRMSERASKYEDDMAYIRNWVANLPRPKSTHFGEFKLEADEIMAVALAAVGQHKVRLT